MCKRSILRGKTLLPVLLSVFLLLHAAPFLSAEEPDSEALDLKALIKELEDEYKNKKSRNVQRIVEIYALFDGLYEEAEPADQKKMIKSIQKAFDIKPPLEDMAFLRAGAACLAGMGELATDSLFKALDAKVLEPKDRSNDQEVSECMKTKAFVIESIGFNKNPDSIKKLFKMLWADETETIKAVCTALSQFNELPFSDKKDIVEELVKRYTQLEALSASNPKRPDYRERLVALEVPFNEALKKLSFQSFDTAPDWQKWFNDHKGDKSW